MNSTEDKFDVILIGSGIGSLSCASILAQLQKKEVLILERHFKIGGFTHIFKRKGKYEWDVGVPRRNRNGSSDEYFENS